MLAPRPSDGMEGLSCPEQPSGGCPLGPTTRKHRNPSGRGGKYCGGPLEGSWKSKYCGGLASIGLQGPFWKHLHARVLACLVSKGWLALFGSPGLPCLDQPGGGHCWKGLSSIRTGWTSMPTGAQCSPVEALEDQAGVIPLGPVLHEPVSLSGQPSLKSDTEL